MTQEEIDKRNKKLVEVVITRSCRAKANDESKNTDYAVGQVVTITGKYAYELISLNKAVVKGSPEHAKWEKDEAKKAASKKELAPTQVNLNEAVAQLAAAVTKIAEQNTAILAELSKEKAKK